MAGLPLGALRAFRGIAAPLYGPLARLLVLPELPLTAIGKVYKPALRAGIRTCRKPRVGTAARAG